MKLNSNVVVRRAPSRKLILLMLGGAALVVCGAAAEPWKAPSRAAKKKNPIAADAASISAGSAVYVKECLSCHGDKGKGDGIAAKDLDPKPGDLSAPSLWDETDGELFWKITNGKKPMPTFETKLSDDQRWSVVNYIRTLSPKPAGAAGGDGKGDGK